MRKRILPVLAGLLLGATACADDEFLTEVPRDFLGPGNFWRNADDAIAAVNGVYASFMTPHGYGVDHYYGRNFYMLVDYPGEQLTSRYSATHDRGSLDAFNYTTEHEYLATVWGGAYAAIASANAVISNVPNISNMDAALRDRVVAEARFLRAIHYFNLVRLFGDVPLRLEEVKTLDNLALPKSPAKDVYDAIIADLEFAAAKLPLTYAGVPGPNTGRATSGAARTLLGKVHLQYGAVHNGGAASYNKAIEQLRQVVQSGRYRLLSDIGRVWALDNENNAEIIFSIQNIRVPGMGGRLAQHVAPRGSNLAGANTAGISFYLEWPFYRDWPTQDRRRAATALTSWNDDGVVRNWSRTLSSSGLNAFGTPGGGPGLTKYLDPNALTGGGEEPDYILLRYSDVLLMLAEAINELSGPTAEAYDAVNQVRARAGLPPLAGLSQQQFREAVQIERRYEFVLEGQTFFDMQRHWEWSKARVERHMRLGRPTSEGGENLNRSPYTSSVPKIGLAGGIVEDRRKFYPIPQAALAQNRLLEQNPAWVGG